MIDTVPAVMSWLGAWGSVDFAYHLLRTDAWQWFSLALVLGCGYLTARSRLRQGTGTEASRFVRQKLAVPLVSGVAALLAAGLLTVNSRSGTLLALVALLASMLALVRVLLRGLLRALQPVPLLAAMEGMAAWVIWLFAALILFGWLQPAVRAMDSLALPLGGDVSVLDALRTALVLIIFLVAASYVGTFAERRLQHAMSLPVGFRVGAAKVLRVVLIVVAILAAFNAVGLDLTTLTVIGGALGVGIGFGLQRVTSNFVSGFILLGDRSIRPGDVISVGERFGVVRELRARYVVVRDRDGVDTLIPNENIITSDVINWSYADRNIRLKLPVQISYEDNPRTAMELMEEAARKHSRVASQPLPAARVMSFDDNGIQLELRFWIRDPEDGINNVRSDLFLAIWDAFKAGGITIPYPQRVLHMKPAAPSGDPPKPSAN